MNETTQSKRQWSRRRKVAILIASALILIAIPILANLFWEMHEARQAYLAFNEALIARDYQRAYSLTTPALQANVSYDAFVQVQSALAARVGVLKDFSTNETNVHHDRNGYFATVESRLIFERGELPFVFQLKKENGQWQVYSFSEE